jgi:hypothetical protein
METSAALIAVIGDIQGQFSLLEPLLAQLPPEAQLISTGNIGGEITSKIQHVRGNWEARLIRQGLRTGTPTSHLNALPLSRTFTWPNRTRLTVVHAGVAPNHTWRDLVNNSEVHYVTRIKNNQADREGAIWHEVYDGRFGYVASGHEPIGPKYYGYSCNLCLPPGRLMAQVFNEQGLVQAYFSS